MQRLWKRSTTAVDAAALPPRVLAAVRAHAELIGADDPSDRITHACLTRSESLERRRLFRGPRESPDVHLLLAPPLLLVVAGDERPVVSFYRLDEIELKPFSAPLIEDSGLDLLGMAVGATERGSRFLPLDDGADATAFRAALDDAVRRARPETG